jgi:hypothetical protein
VLSPTLATTTAAAAAAASGRYSVNSVTALQQHHEKQQQSPELGPLPTPTAAAVAAATAAAATAVSGSGTGTGSITSGAMFVPAPYLTLLGAAGTRSMQSSPTKVCVLTISNSNSYPVVHACVILALNMALLM